MDVLQSICLPNLFADSCREEYAAAQSDRAPESSTVRLWTIILTEAYDRLRTSDGRCVRCQLQREGAPSELDRNRRVDFIVDAQHARNSRWYPLLVVEAKKHGATAAEVLHAEAQAQNACESILRHSRDRGRRHVFALTVQGTRVRCWVHTEHWSAFSPPGFPEISTNASDTRSAYFDARDARFGWYLLHFLRYTLEFSPFDLATRRARDDDLPQTEEIHHRLVIGAQIGIARQQRYINPTNEQEMFYQCWHDPTRLSNLAETSIAATQYHKTIRVFTVLRENNRDDAKILLARLLTAMLRTLGKDYSGIIYSI